MDIVEINKRLQRKWTDPALDHLYELISKLHMQE